MIIVIRYIIYKDKYTKFNYFLDLKKKKKDICRDKCPKSRVGPWALSEDVWVIRGETNSYKKFQFEVPQGRDEWRAVQG